MIRFVFFKDPHDSCVGNKSEGGKSKWKRGLIRESKASAVVPPGDAVEWVSNEKNGQVRELCNR